MLKFFSTISKVVDISIKRNYTHTFRLIFFDLVLKITVESKFNSNLNLSYFSFSFLLTKSKHY
jgi:hypothetical protein